MTIETSVPASELFSQLGKDRGCLYRCKGCQHVGGMEDCVLARGYDAQRKIGEYYARQLDVLDVDPVVKRLQSEGRLGKSAEGK